MVGTSWVMTGVEYDEYVSLLSGLCASDLKGATQRCRIFYFILIITVEKNPVLIQSKKAKGRAPANDRQKSSSTLRFESLYYLSGYELFPISHTFRFPAQATITV